jgi:hypothetical protein
VPLKTLVRTDYGLSFAQIALHFVQDTSTRFELAIECGNLDVAMETAREIDRPECWERLAAQALKQGNHQASHSRCLSISMVADIGLRLLRRPIKKPRISTSCHSCTLPLAARISSPRCRQSQMPEEIQCRGSTLHCTRAMWGLGFPS